MNANNLDFSEIAPYDDCQFEGAINKMVLDPGFEHAIRWVMPNVDYPDFIARLKSCHTKADFQERMMQNFLNGLEKQTTAGISASGIEKISHDKSYTFITNHRDIVLDASFLNLVFLRNGVKTSEVAIGNNLLIYEWITHLVKLNGSFIVKRNLPTLQALDAAKELSAYIHHAILNKNASIWIAQRQGRAKDSSDQTQESVLKMLSLAGEGSLAQNLAEINIFPTAISYEFDPNDYLKAREYLLHHRDPEFKKSQRDDLFSMETGLMQYKGRVHFSFSNCITPFIESISPSMDRLQTISRICHQINYCIHSRYKIYPINYVAYDKAFDSDMYRDRYTDEELAKVVDYIEGQLDKVDIPDVTSLERNFMRSYMYMMYANPLRNKLLAAGSC